MSISMKPILIASRQKLGIRPDAGWLLTSRLTPLDTASWFEVQQAHDPHMAVSATHLLQKGRSFCHRVAVDHPKSS